jgi:hypothetical protein
MNHHNLASSVVYTVVVDGGGRILWDSGSHGDAGAGAGAGSANFVNLNLFRDDSALQSILTVARPSAAVVEFVATGIFANTAHYIVVIVGNRTTV